MENDRRTLVGHSFVFMFMFTFPNGLPISKSSSFQRCCLSPLPSPPPKPPPRPPESGSDIVGLESLPGWALLEAAGAGLVPELEAGTWCGLCWLPATAC